jgi:hypothetical protein
MKKVTAKALFGYGNNVCYEEEFEFDDNYTEEEIESTIWDWAEQFLEVDWEITEDDEEAD